MQTSDDEYDDSEIRSTLADVERYERAPLADRRAARDDWREGLKDPALIEECATGLLQGDYGHGAYILAHRIRTASTRANKVARIGQLLAALEWQCPAEFAAQAWKRSAPDIQRAANAAIQRALDARDEE